MQLSEFVIEVTRRCNMACGHCLRGPARPVDLDVKKLRTFLTLNKINNVGPVTFTGGEPSLRPHIIEGCLNLFKELNVSMHSFYIATNGKMISDKFIEVIMNLHLYTDEPDCNAVRVSNDIFHDAEMFTQHGIEKLMMLKLAGHGERRTNFIDEGRAKNIQYANRSRDFYLPKVDLWDQVEGMVYFNALGEIVSDCDLSYVSQKKYKICNYNEPLINFLEKDYQEPLPLVDESSYNGMSPAL